METKYKINIHVLEACNFRCRQCFSKFGTKKLLPVEGWKKIIDNCIRRLKESSRGIKKEGQ